MHSSSIKRKFKGGAEQNREKQQKILNRMAQKYHKISDMFSPASLNYLTIEETVIENSSHGLNVIIDTNETNYKLVN